jgi:GNAT superfamily N-acetyltransferase
LETKVSDFSECPDVRLADIEDIPSLMALTKLASEEDAQHPYDAEKVWNVVRRHYDKTGGLVAVAGPKGEPIRGYLIMIVDEIWYSPDYQLLELSLFVDPQYRKSTLAKQLMAFSKAASEGLKLDLTIGVLSNDRTAAKVRLYQRQFKTAGAYFLYRPQSAANG